MQSFVALCVLLLIGHFFRSHLRCLRWLYLPSCVIAGILGLLVIQGSSEHYAWLDYTIPASWTAGWSKLPGLLIDVVFACLFLGVRIPNLKTVWRQAGPQLAYGQVVAWGQYVVGVGMVLFLLGPLFGVPPMFGGIVPVGFEGGHGTAGGMKEVFAKYDFPEGGDLGLASATAGMVLAIVIGMSLLNIAVRCGWLVRGKPQSKGPADEKEDDTIGVIPVEERPEAGKLTVRSDVIESFTMQLIFVGLAVGFGYLLKEGLVYLEAYLNADLIQQIQDGKAIENERIKTAAYILRSFPRFPLCMIGGILIQIWSQKYDKHKLIDYGLTRRIQNSSLEFLVVAAIASINIVTLTGYLWPFLIIVAAGVAWNVFCLLFLAKRMLPDAWFERSIAEMGQSMGVTATGLLLLRVADPDYKTPAAKAFAYKQIIHEPFMGGGLWTSTAIPLLAIWGCGRVFGIACGAVAIWLLLTFCTPLIPRR